MGSNLSSRYVKFVQSRYMDVKESQYARKFQDCSLYKDFMEGLRHFESIAVNLESDYKCSGFCMANSKFVFTSQKNSPTNSCKDAVVDEYNIIKANCKNMNNMILFSSSSMILIHLIIIL